MVTPQHLASPHLVSCAPNVIVAVAADGAARPGLRENTYNYTKSTEENYAVDTILLGEFVGELAVHRKTLDYNYHKRYGAARQALQDGIVREFLQTLVVDTKSKTFCDRPINPWVVFTAGAMGAGKSRCLRWMAQQLVFPLASFVHVSTRYGPVQHR